MPTRITDRDIDTAADHIRETIALIEGDIWHNYDKERSEHNRSGSTRYAIERFIRQDFTDTIVIYGAAGISRYFIDENTGEVVFSESHHRQQADKARAVGFRVE